MAPTYRTATQTRRGNRGAVEVHDDFEGLPVRQWRRATINILPPKPAPTVKQSDVWLYEQIHGMPKDWRQLPPHNQELVRAARAGYLNPKPEDDKDKDKKDKSASRLASIMFSSSKSVFVSGSIGRRSAVGTNGQDTSSEATLAANGDAAAGGEGQDAPNPRKRASPDGEESALAKESNKRQALEKQPVTIKEETPRKPKSSEPQSELDREIALAKARAKANGEDVDIVVEHKFKVSDPAKARPIVRVISRSQSKPAGEDVETAQEKRERRKELFKNTKEGLEFEVWRAVPRSDEGYGLSYLAKRHKNTITLSSKAAETQTTGPTVTRAIVRRIDAAGNPYEQTVTLEEGQTITDGEIISTAVVPAPTAPEMASVQATPVKRRPPPPKRKGKGPGRGRKKGKLPIAPSTRPLPDGTAPTDAAGATGAAPGTTSSAETPTQNGEGSTNQDTEMMDSPAVHSDEEDGEDGDDDDGEEGDEGDNDEANESEITQDQDQEMKDVSILEETVQPILIEEPDESSAASTSDEDPLMARSKPSNPLNLALPHSNSPRLEGSPLKNVVSITPTNQSPIMSPSLQATSLASKDAMDIDSTPEVGSEVPPSELALDTPDIPVAIVPEPAATVETVAEKGTSDIPAGTGISAALDVAVEEMTDAPVLEAPPPVTEAITTEEIPLPAKEFEPEPPTVDETPVPIVEKVAEPELETAPPAPEQKAEPTPVPMSEPELEKQTEKVATPAPEPEPEAEAAPESVPLSVVQEPSKSETEPTTVEPAVTEAEAGKTETEAPAPVPAVIDSIVEPVTVPATEPVPEAAAPAPATADEDDGMPDLLGGLERELDRQAAVDGNDETKEGKIGDDKKTEEAAVREAEKGPDGA